MTTKNAIVSIDDLLLVQRASAAEYGVDKIAQTIQSEVNYTNAQVSQMVSEMCTLTTSQIIPWGNQEAHLMTQLTELGQAVPQKMSVGINASVPLKRFGQSLGWTVKAFEIMTPAELANQFLAARQGYLLQVQRQIKKAVFTSASATWTDSLYNGVSLTLYPFANGDSTTIPTSPAGSTFSNHNHYNGASAFSPSAVNDLITDVVEHGNTRNLNIYCSLSDVSNFTSASAGFTALPDERTQTLLTQLVSGQTVDVSDYENKLIGYWNGGGGAGVPVNVRSWVPQHYYVCMSLGMGEKPLLFRQRPQQSLQGWRINPLYKDSPIYAQEMEAEFGVNAYNRVMAAVLYDQNATYTSPTIA